MTVEILPLDEHNRELVSQVHPADWRNPQADGVYNMIAIGGGTAGIIAAMGTAGLGGKAALIERHLLGGDCLNYGCVPSKALIRAARAAHHVRGAAAFGVETREADGRVAFDRVMERMRRLRARISHHDAAERLAGVGIDVYLGEARFTGPDRLEVAGRTLRFRRCVIATGARAARPPIDGLDGVEYLTNETLFSLTELPRRLVVIGGGPIGAEMAQAFRRFGSEVTVIDTAPRILSREEPEAARLVQSQIEREGIMLRLETSLERVERSENGAKRLVLRRGDEHGKLEADALLLAVGRTPNLEGLGLEAAGVEMTSRGVKVDDFLRSTNRRVFAAGDVAGSYQFTHAADAMARACVQNAFFRFGPLGGKRLSGLVIPRTTYTDPEVASVGLTAASAAKEGVEIQSYREDLTEVDRAVLDGEEEGFALVHCKRGSGKVAGATIVAAHAGEMMGELSLLMTAGLSLERLASTVHCYPTQVEVLKRIADQYQRGRLTKSLAALLKRILRWR